MGRCPGQFEETPYFEGTPYTCGIPGSHENCAAYEVEGIAVVSYRGRVYAVSLTADDSTKIPGSSLTYTNLSRYAKQALPKKAALPVEEVF